MKCSKHTIQHHERHTQMAIQKRKTKSGKTAWIGRVRAPGGEISKSFTRRADAAAWVSEMDSDIRRRLRGRRSDVTMKELARLWEMGAACDGSRKVRQRLTRHLGHLSVMLVQDVRPDHIREWMLGLRRSLADSTTTMLLSQMRAMLNQAVNDGLVMHSAAAAVKGPRVRTTVVEKKDIPTAEHVAAITDACKTPTERAVIRTLAATGMRPGELAGLEWQDLDHGAGTISIHRQADEQGTGTRELKTAAGRRVIGADPATLDTLYSLAHGTPTPGTRIFGTANAVWVYSIVRKCAARAGLTFTPRDFRHFHATMLLAGGVPIKAVQHRLGHASARVTMDVYASFLAIDDDLGVEVTTQALGG